MTLLAVAALFAASVALNARHQRRVARWDRRAVCRPVATLAEHAEATGRGDRGAVVGS